MWGMHWRTVPLKTCMTVQPLSHNNLSRCENNATVKIQLMVELMRDMQTEESGAMYSKFAACLAHT